MPPLFNSETARTASHAQDAGKLVEIDQHQLLRTDNEDLQIATFDQIRELGQWFLSLNFNSVLPSTQPLPEKLLRNHDSTQRGAFLGKLALGANPESQFPVTIESVITSQGMSLRLHIVPIHFGALEIAQFGHHTDSLLALAAAAAVSPQFILALEGGIATTHCEAKNDVVTSIKPDHGTPLAVTFDAFELGRQTLDTATYVTGNRDLSIKQAAHLHGQEKQQTQQLSLAAAGSKIAAGVPLKTVLRSELPKHALFIQTVDDGYGVQRIVSIKESLIKAGIGSVDLSLLAAALGFTARVVGISSREQMIENVLKPTNADLPLTELVK